MTITCPNCQRVEPESEIFCRSCWVRVPAADRIIIGQAKRQGTDLAPIITRIVKDLKKR